VLSVSRMKRLPGYLTAKPNLALYQGTLATVLFTLPNGLAGTDFWSTPLYTQYTTILDEHDSSMREYNNLSSREHYMH